MLSTLQNPLNKMLQKLFKALLLVYVMMGTSLYFLQEKLLFHPTELSQNYQYEFNYPFDELFLEPEKEVSINAIHFKVKQPKGVILYFHGNAGDLSRWGAIAEYFVSKNYDVFIMDYRTYGKSKGKLSEQAFYDDAQYCYNYLLKDYSEGDVTVYGRSLGTGIATYIASKNNSKQLVLETPFYSILDVAKHRFPMFPLASLLKYKFPSHQYIADVNCPITIFHGTNDQVVPYHSAEKLKIVAPKDSATFITIKDGNHNDLIEFEDYRMGIDQIL